jgi:hypothetical protein
VRCYVHLRDQKLMEVLSSHNSQLEHHENEHFFDVVAFSAASLSSEDSGADYSYLVTAAAGEAECEGYGGTFCAVWIWRICAAAGCAAGGVGTFSELSAVADDHCGCGRGQAAAEFAKRFPRFGPAVNEIRDWGTLESADEWSSQELASADGQPAAGKSDRGIHYV